MIKTILFDLDGTLLPMDQEEFVNSYFAALAKRMAPIGYDPKMLVNSVWKGTKAMVMNDGSSTNEEVFWNVFAEIYGEKAKNDMPVFDDFYKNEFNAVKDVCTQNVLVPNLVKDLKQSGYRLVLATNSIFPRVATENRIRWAGLSPQDFEFVTTYENSCCSKPNPQYYRFILEKLGLEPSECLMVGNDVTEDMVASKLGIQVFLITDFLINSENKDISVYPNGDFNDLIKFIKSQEV